MASVEIRLDNSTKVHYEGEILKGKVFVESKSPFSHQGVTVLVEGNVMLSLNSKNVGTMEAMVNKSKQIPIVFNKVDLLKPGKFIDSVTELPFQLELKSNSSNPLYETYHGVQIQIQYFVKCIIKRTLLQKDLVTQSEVLVEYAKGEKAVRKPVKFHINPQSIENIKTGTMVPNFSIKGELDSLACRMSDPFSGELMIERSEMPIRSIELQLLRVETVGSSEYSSKNVSEIQNIEVGSGDVAHLRGIPLYMLLPRLFSCPSLQSTNFCVDFELNVAVVFQNDVVITENFPLTITRF